MLYRVANTASIYHFPKEDRAMRAKSIPFLTPTLHQIFTQDVQYKELTNNARTAESTEYGGNKYRRNG
ncbi:hypothetical protein Hypma_003335 [Hypsizygus marmoreus]|uniref:Uncharacterized protein n=1 Tax=Hypsizygus marmoreus TaxID=39966 RepID=A0A369J2C2_HYPMA|nr:hypothetical protein Hypma_003335 [Hypsizygus marmoreus]